MNIQLITYNKQNNSFGTAVQTINTFGGARVMDDFDINVVDLTDSHIWCNKGRDYTVINIKKDFITLGKLIKRNVNSKILILLPQNISFNYYYFNGGYSNSEKLKDILNTVRERILSDILQYDPFTFAAGITYTKIGKSDIKSDFYFSNVSDHSVASRNKNNTVTSVYNSKNIVSTFLDIESQEDLVEFIKLVGFSSSTNEDAPDWFEKISMFDDATLQNQIDSSNSIIKAQEEIINNATLGLDRNNRWKSILYTYSEELVDVVFEMFEQLLDVDLSGFKDERREDFNFQYENKTVIGEIKGVSSGVKNSFVSQLDTNVWIYKENNPDDINEIVSLLIVNPQRKLPPEKRDPVQEDQIRIANRNQSLIIETSQFLKLFEKYKSGILSREECWDIISKEKGLLTI